jgi:predicted DCC family thiol-disulfide oxidoreductase YuxK
MKFVFFDGYCSLCNALIDWLIRIDKTGELKFASLQGETANRLLVRDGKPLDIDTVIYLRNDQKYERSTAVLLILSDIGGFWRLTQIFFLIPKFIRDFVYKAVAKNRFRILKKRESCRMPTQDERERILP